MTGHSQISSGISFIHHGMNQMSDNIQGTAVQPSCKAENIAELKQLALEMQDIVISNNYNQSLLELEIPKLSSTIELPAHLLLTMFSLHNNGPVSGEVVCRDLKTQLRDMHLDYSGKGILYDRLEKSEFPVPIWEYLGKTEETRLKNLQCYMIALWMSDYPDRLLLEAKAQFTVKPEGVETGDESPVEYKLSETTKARINTFNNRAKAAELNNYFYNILEHSFGKNSGTDVYSVLNTWKSENGSRNITRPIALFAHLIASCKPDTAALQVYARTATERINSRKRLSDGSHESIVSWQNRTEIKAELQSLSKFWGDDVDIPELKELKSKQYMLNLLLP